MDKNSLAHTHWECKHHIMFAPKYRRQVIYGKIKVEVGKMLRELCERKGVEIREAECCPDHIHNVRQDTAEVQRIGGNGVSERQKLKEIAPLGASL